MALQDFTYFVNRSSGGIGAEEVNSDRARAALTEVQKYDPTASFVPVYGSENNLTGYRLDYDASKLPGLSGGLLHGTTTGHGSGGDFVPRFSTVQDQMKLVDPNAVTNSDLYGKVTDNTNISHPKTTMDWLGPLLVAGFGFGMGGIPGLTEGFGAQFQAPGMGGMDLSGLGASDPFLQGGTGAMDMTGSAGTGIPGSFGANAPLGSAESSLFGTGVQADPASAFGGGTQAAAPIADLGTAASASDIARLAGPGVAKRLTDAATALLKNGAGLLAPAGGGAGGGGLLGGGGGGMGGKVDADNAAEILRRFYAAQAINPMLAARSQGRF